MSQQQRALLGLQSASLSTSSTFLTSFALADSSPSGAQTAGGPHASPAAATSTWATSAEFPSRAACSRGPTVISSIATVGSLDASAPSWSAIASALSGVGAWRAASGGTGGCGARACATWSWRRGLGSRKGQASGASDLGIEPEPYKSTADPLLVLLSRPVLA